MEIIENALADGAGAKDSAGEAELAGDSDAVVSVFYPEQQKIGELLSHADGRPTVLYRGLQLVTLAGGARFALTNAANNVKFADLDEATDLLHVSALLAGVGITSFLLPLESTRVALMPGGFLQQLKVGEQKISLAAARRLARWRVLLCTLAGVLSTMGLLILIILISRQMQDGLQDNALQKLIVVLIWLGPMPVLAAGWWPSMFTASCLCRDNVLEVIKKVRAADPTEEPLDEVATSALALRDLLHKLSEGWGAGLLGLCSFFLSMCVSQLALALSTEWCAGVDHHNPQYAEVLGSARNMVMFFVVLLAFLPLLIAMDLATTSSLCDMLMEELNSAGIRHGVEHDPTIDWIVRR